MTTTFEVHGSRAGVRRSAVALVVLVTAACTAGGTKPNAARPLGGPRLGGEPSAFAVRSDKSEGTEAFRARAIVQWESIQGARVVSTVAGRWTVARQRAFARSGADPVDLANRFAKRWGPGDETFVSSDIQGGTLIGRYESTRLAALTGVGRGAQFRDEEGDCLDGDFSVVVVLETDQKTPAAFGKPFSSADPGHQMFTIAAMLGSPWQEEPCP